MLFLSLGIYIIQFILLWSSKYSETRKCPYISMILSIILQDFNKTLIWYDEKLINRVN